MKFLFFNVVVIGALYFLYQLGGGSVNTHAAPAQATPGQAESGSQERAVVHALADQVNALAHSVALLEDHVSEVIQQGDDAEAATREATEAAEKSAAEAAASRTASSGNASPREPRPKAPIETAGSEFRPGPQAAARDMRSEWSDGAATASAADLEAADFSDSRSTVTASADAPLVEGELMTASQRRNALLQLAQDMELHYLASAGE